MADAETGGQGGAAIMRGAGALIALAALVLVFVPTLVHDPGPAPDLFEAIEQRVRWGAGVSFGMLLMVHPWRRPWSVVFAWVVFCVSAGYLVARIAGMALVGLGSERQWMWTAVEIVICAAAAAWIRRRRDAPDRKGR